MYHLFIGEILQSAVHLLVGYYKLVKLGNSMPFFISEQ